jgi:hypothetical protein
MRLRLLAAAALGWTAASLADDAAGQGQWRCYFGEQCATGAGTAAPTGPQPPPPPPRPRSPTPGGVRIEVCPTRMPQGAYFALSFDGRNAHGWYRAEGCRVFPTGLNAVPVVYVFAVAPSGAAYAPLPAGPSTRMLPICVGLSGRPGPAGRPNERAQVHGGLFPYANWRGDCHGRRADVSFTRVPLGGEDDLVRVREARGG